MQLQPGAKVPGCFFIGSNVESSGVQLFLAQISVLEAEASS